MEYPLILAALTATRGNQIKAAAMRERGIDLHTEVQIVGKDA